jgi:hypothetical protein
VRSKLLGIFQDLRIFVGKHKSRGKSTIARSQRLRSAKFRARTLCRIYLGVYRNDLRKSLHINNDCRGFEMWVYGQAEESLLCHLRFAFGPRCY